MIYLRVGWDHDFPDEPVVTHSELDADRFEVRRVELFRDGRRAFACAQEECGTFLAPHAYPAEEEIARDPQFTVEVCDAAEFERAWADARLTCKGGLAPEQ